MHNPTNPKKPMPTGRAELHGIVARMNFDSLRAKWRFMNGQIPGAMEFTPGERRAVLHRMGIDEEMALLRHLSLSYTTRPGH